MAAAVSIAPSGANRRDLVTARNAPAALKPEAEAPLTPTNKDLHFRSEDLGVLVATESPRHDTLANASATPALLLAPEATASSQTEAHAGNRVVLMPKASPLSYAFDMRQQWEGVVTRVASDEFSVVLRDLTDRSAPELEAVLPLEEVSEEDLPLLCEGAVLYWTIGYEQTQTGQRKRVSIIRLRRLPAWTRSDLERVRKRADELSELFGNG